MNPETQAWQRLRDLGSARLSPGFADGVLRAARADPEPSLLGQFMLSVATAALCFFAATLVQSRISRADNERVQADWQQIASATDDSGLGLSQ